MRYTVKLVPAAQRDLDRADKPIRARLLSALRELESDPRPAGIVKLSGMDARRIRVGDWRIIYEIRDAVLLVLVLRIGHRREVYR